jgi:signal transduction histidine kinase/CheY-like chemotaxis protein
MDILERKNIELKEFLENLPLGFVSGRLINKNDSVGNDLYIEEVNQRFSGLFNKNKSYFIGKRLLDLFPEFEQVFNQQAGVIQSNINLFKNRFQHVVLPAYNLNIEVFLSRFKNGKGSLVIRDPERITEPEQLPDNIHRQFLSNMSHEIRTPLNGIMGFSEMLILEERDHQKRRMLKMIEESGNQLLTIINDIFDFAIIESGKIELNERTFNIIELINSTVSFFQQQAAAKGLEIRTDYHHVIQPEMIGDSLKVSQIVVNLISNAIKFTDTGWINISAKSYIKDNRIAVQIIVEDTGIGIMPQDLDIIFHEFKQLEFYLTKRIKGTGIGLSITKKLVEFMGGKIIAESEPQNGSRFTVSLFMKNKSENKSKTFMEEQANIENAEPQKVRILLAEDNEANQFLIKAITKSENWQITVVDDGEKAVEAFKNNEFDLILMDVQMPVLNGYEATQRIREIEKERDSRTPIIALTAYAMKSDKDLCIEAGMDDYISKPFKRQQFLDAIARMLENK